MGTFNQIGHVAGFQQQHAECKYCENSKYQCNNSVIRCKSHLRICPSASIEIKQSFFGMSFENPEIANTSLLNANLPGSQLIQYKAKSDLLQ